jgi:GAF domain-containing protein
MAHADILVTVRSKYAARYAQLLSGYPELGVRVARSLDQALDLLSDRSHPVDLLVLDNGLSGVFELVADLRQTYPRLLIVLVDEEADFAMPGQADDISTDPFTDGDLVRRISRLISDRHLETLRADSMSPLREFVKKLRKADGEREKLHVAVSACREIGYEYVAVYRLDSLDPLQITLQAQEGEPPLKASPSGIIASVARNGQSRLATPPTDGTAPAGRLSAVACTSIGMTSRYGVLVACRTTPNTITQPQVTLLEMISAQLAAALAKE